MNRKRNILIVAIILMAVGFAVVTTNLIINGNVAVSNNASDYDIKFTKATLEGVENNNLIKESGKKIIYETKKLMKMGDTSELIYEITNNSSQYDAEVTIKCAAKGETTHKDLYEINTSNTPNIIKAKSSESGSIKVSLSKETMEEIREEFECELTINALERTSVGIDTSDYIYGVRRNLNSSSTTWERIENSVGLTANATLDGSEVQNDFDDIYPWSNIITYNYDDETKTENAYLGDDNFKYDGSNGQVLTRIPEFYYKREQRDEYEYIYITKKEQEGYTKSETFSVGRYTMSGDSNKVFSKSGVSPLTNTTITDFRNYAKNLGSDFGQLDYRYFILQLLYLVEYADYNSQSVLGQGNTNNSVALASGGCDSLGMKSGSITNDGKHSVIYRGIEDIFGNVHQFVDGINLKDHVAYINYNPETYMVDIFDGNYQMLGYVNAKANDFISALGYDDNNSLIGLPTNVGGNENTYISDYYEQDSGNRIFVGGGCYVNSSQAGLWYWWFKGASNHNHQYNGARLLRFQ